MLMMKKCRKTAGRPNIYATGMCSVRTPSVNLVLCDTGQKSQWKLFLPLTCLLAFIMINGGRERVRAGGNYLSFELVLS